MSDSQSSQAPVERRVELVQEALKSKLAAISGYDEILWKIRTGYLVVLYGASAVIVGKEGVVGQSTLPFGTGLSLWLLVFGLSFAAFFVDFGYSRKKFKVIVARDALMRIALDDLSKPQPRLAKLLQIAGESDVKDKEIFTKNGDYKHYTRIRNWNLLWIHLPLYATPPAAAAASLRLLT